MLDHPTPWIAIAPVLQRAHWVTTRAVYRTASGFTDRVSQHLVGAVVATGPGHVIALGVAVVIGLWAWRRPPTPSGLLWLAALCLALRCVFESVEDPYYVWPALGLLLIGAATRPQRRFVLALGASVAVTILAECSLGPWAWYLSVMTMLGVVLASASPAEPIWTRPAVRGRGGAPFEIANGRSTALERRADVC